MSAGKNEGRAVEAQGGAARRRDTERAPARTPRARRESEEPEVIDLWPPVGEERPRTEGAHPVSLPSAELVSVDSSAASGRATTVPAGPLVPVPVLPGHVVAHRYEVLGVAGEGGMGVVYRCRDRVTGDTVALKRMVSPDTALTADYVAWFYKEARALAVLDHPSIVHARDFGRLVDGTPYLVMDFVSGPSLHDLGGATLSFPLIWSIVDQILGALAHAHAHGVTHGDLKPSNVVVLDHFPEAPGVGILDFGLAWLNRDPRDERLEGLATLESPPHAGAGTPGYMAPEQIQHEMHHVSGPTDLYSLGCILYRMLSGKAPFDGGAKELLQKHAFVAPPALVPMALGPAHARHIEGVVAFVTRLLGKRPWQRFDCAGDARRAWQPFRPVAPAADDYVLPVVDEEPVCCSPASEPTRPDGARRNTRRLDELREHAPGLLSVRPSPLVGRDPLRAHLLGLCQDMIEGRGTTHRLVVLAGPGGIGKSRMAEWLCEHVHEEGLMVPLKALYREVQGPHDGMLGAVASHFNFERSDRFGIERSLIARWTEGASRSDSTLTLIAGIAEWLRPTPPGKQPPLGPTGKRFTLDTLDTRRQVIRHTLRRIAGKKPLLFWLDDLHHASAATLDGLARIFEDEPEQRILMVGTARTDSGLLPDALQRLVDDVNGEVLPIEPLDDATIRRLLRAALPLDGSALDEAARRARGNPLFALQQLHAWALAGEVSFVNGSYEVSPAVLSLRPTTTAEFWDARLHAVPERYRMGALAATALGAEVHRDVLTALLASLRLRPERVIASLQDAQVLVPRDETALVWPHSLLREHLRAQLQALSEAPAVFRAAAAALEKHPLAKGRRIVRARVRNLVQAGLPEQGAELLFDFIEQSWRRTREAKATLADLDDFKGTMGERHAALRCFWRAEALRMLGRFEEAASTVQAARRGFEAAGNDAMLARTLRLEGHVRSEQGHPHEGLELAREAHALALGLGDGLAAAQAGTVIAEIEYLLGRYESARRVSQEAEGIFAELGFALGRGQSLLLQSWVAHSEGDVEVARNLAVEARAQFEEAGYRLGQAQVDVMLAHIEYRLLNFRTAEQNARSGLVAMNELFSKRGVAACERLLGLIGLDTDNLDMAELHIAAAARRYEDLGDAWGRVEGRALLCQVALARGRVADAQEHLDAARRLEVEEAEPRQHLLLTEAWLEQAAGNPGAATTALEAAATVYPHRWQGGDHAPLLLARLSRLSWSPETLDRLETWRALLGGPGRSKAA